MFKSKPLTSGMLAPVLILMLSTPLLAADADEKAKKEALKSELKSDRKELQSDKKELRSDRKELNQDQKALSVAKKKGASKEDLTHFACRWFAMRAETIFLVRELGIEVPAEVLTAIANGQWNLPEPPRVNVAKPH